MSEWWLGAFFLFLILKDSFTHCKEYQCHYTVKKKDNSSDVCSGDQCDRFLDLNSMMVEPKTCKTSLLRLSFSSYKSFVQFRDQLRWKMEDFFPSYSIEGDRQLILFLKKLDQNDQPFDQKELMRLGKNIDSITLYIQSMEQNHSLSRSIFSYSQWNIIQLKLRCRKFSAFDKYPCSSDILSPSLIVPQRSFPTFHLTTSTPFLSSTTMYESRLLKYEETKTNSFHFILIIVIPILIILLSIFVYFCFIRGHIFQKKRNVSTSSLPNEITSNHSIHLENICSSSDRTTIIPQSELIDDATTNPVVYHIPHRHTLHQLPRQSDNNYERVQLDQISISRQQYFSPLSSTNRF